MYKILFKKMITAFYRKKEKGYVNRQRSRTGNGTMRVVEAKIFFRPFALGIV